MKNDIVYKFITNNYIVGFNMDSASKSSTPTLEQIVESSTPTLEQIEENEWKIIVYLSNSLWCHCFFLLLLSDYYSSSITSASNSNFGSACWDY